MRKLLSITGMVLLLTYSVNLSAQKSDKKGDQPLYKTAVGIKIYPFAVSLKTFTTRKAALEFLGYFNDGFRLTGLYEFHGTITKGQNLKWYIGFGGHLGLGNQNAGNDAKIGVDGIIGVDYKFLHLPLNLSLDWQPAVGIGDGSAFTADRGGIAVRFAF